MASVKFGKDSKEWSIFAEFWALYQKYGVPERGNDKYWEDLIKEAGAFGRKYDTHLSKKLAVLLCEELEYQSKQ